MTRVLYGAESPFMQAWLEKMHKMTNELPADVWFVTVVSSPNGTCYLSNVPADLLPEFLRASATVHETCVTNETDA